MPSAHGAHIKYAWQQQPDAVLSEVNPVSGTPYGVGALAAAVEDVRIISAVATVTWTVQPTPLEIHIAIDGVNITHFVDNPISTQYYDAKLSGGTSEATQPLDAASLGQYRAFLYGGQSIAVTAETTGGTVSNLSCRIKWARLLPT